MFTPAKVVTRRFFPVFDNQKVMRLNLWRTDSGIVRYCEENGCELAATIDLEMPNTIGE